MTKLLQPQFNQRKNTWEIDVPGDESCLFWAVTLAYLIPIKDDDYVFKKRFEKLFGKTLFREVSLQQLEHIKCWIRTTYNPFSKDEASHRNEVLTGLIRKQFRYRIVNHMEEPKNRGRFVHHVSSNEGRLDEHLNRVKDPNTWGGELEIRALSELLDCRIQVTRDSVDLPPYGNGSLVQLFHVRATPVNREVNHYHFGLEKILGDNYQLAIRAVVGPRQEEEHATSSSQSVSITNNSESLLDRFLSLLPSKELFEKEYRKLYSEEGEVIYLDKQQKKYYFLNRRLKSYMNAKDISLHKIKEMYLQTLAEIKTAIQVGDLSKFQILAQLVDFINKTEFKYLLELFYKRESTIKDTNTIILACKHNQLESLRYLVNRHVPIEPYPIKPDDKDEEGRTAADYAAVHSDIVNFHSILDQWLGKTHGRIAQLKSQNVEMVLPNVDAHCNIKTMNVAAIMGTGNVVHDSKIKVIGKQVILPRPKPAEHLPEIWKVPPKNPNFVGRNELIGQIKEQLNKESTPVILTALEGLGGVGKTQLALEFVWQHHLNYKGVAWFDAESQERLTEDYIRLGLELNIIHQDDKDAIEGRALRVKHWLEAPKHASWLVVYDNAPNYKAIVELLPTKGGKVLVTSRYAEGWPQDNIQVNVFTPDESRVYIEKILGDKALDTKQVNQLAKTLGHLPLALAQACAYIKKNPVSIERYLELYETRKKKLLSDKTLADQTSLTDSNQAIVYITWNITIEAIRKESILANRWLAICAYLNSNDIPNFLLKIFSEISDNNPDDEVFEEALGTLKSYSMLFIDERISSASIHRLVQEVILLKAEAGERLKNIVALLELFQECFPYRGQTHEDYTKKRQLLPHLEALFSNLDAWQKTATLELKKYMEEDSLEKVLFLTYVGYHDLGNWQKAREMLERSLTIKEFRYGHDHPSTLTTRNNMAGVLSKQGKYEEALQAYQEVFDIRKGELGPEHLDTLTTRHNMAGVLSKQGKYEEALQAYQEVFDKRKDLLGPEHPGTLTTRNNMALVLSDQGKYEEALQAYQEVFDIWKRELGPEHPDTLTTRDNMAGVLSDQGKYDEALQAYQEVFDKRKDLLGPEHPGTLTTRNNMASVLSDQGKYEEALQAYQEVFDKRKDLLGPEHPDTLTTRNNMAGVLDNQGKYEEALQAYQDVYDKRKDLLGPKHPDTITTWNNIFLTLVTQGKFQGALQYFLEGCVIRNRACDYKECIVENFDLD